MLTDPFVTMADARSFASIILLDGLRRLWSRSWRGPDSKEVTYSSRH